MRWRCLPSRCEGKQSVRVFAATTGGAKLGLVGRNTRIAVQASRPMAWPTTYEEATLVNTVRTLFLGLNLLWLLTALSAVFAATPCVGQVTYCVVDRTVIEQSADWCQRRNAPSVIIASPNKPTDLEATKLLQLQLWALGFDPAGIDGVIGPGTSTARHQSRQRSIGQNGDGLVTPALKAQLDERTRSKPAAIDVPKSETPPPITNTVSGIASPTFSTQSEQEGSKSERQSDGSVAWGIAIIVGALAAIVWMLFALVKFVRSLPRRFCSCAPACSLSCKRTRPWLSLAR